MHLDNILLQIDAATGQPLFAVLNDFGEALSLAEDQSFVMPYVRGFNVGGASKFLPPEIMLAKPGKEGSLDFSKSDIFGAGMVLYQLLQGPDSSPFEGRDGDHRVYTADNYKEPSACYDEDVKQLVRQLLSPDPAQRPMPADAQILLAAMDC